MSMGTHRRIGGVEVAAYPDLLAAWRYQLEPGDPVAHMPDDSTGYRSPGVFLGWTEFEGDAAPDVPKARYATVELLCPPGGEEGFTLMADVRNLYPDEYMRKHDMEQWARERESNAVLINQYRANAWSDKELADWVRRERPDLRYAYLDGVHFWKSGRHAIAFDLVFYSPTEQPPNNQGYVGWYGIDLGMPMCQPSTGWPPGITATEAAKILGATKSTNGDAE